MVVVVVLLDSIKTLLFDNYKLGSLSTKCYEPCKREKGPKLHCRTYHYN
jgi:hypothetical protein